MDPYKVLGIARDASESDIRRAFHVAAKKYHPDKNPDDKNAEERFKEINKAYEMLSSGTFAENFTRSTSDFSLDDIISELFSNPFKKSKNGSDFPDLEDGGDILNIRIPRETAINGGRIIVPYGPERLRVHIPAGTYDGQKLRLKGIAGNGDDIIVHVYLD
jgi:DnaJ-class molecular chaperone